MKSVVLNLESLARLDGGKVAAVVQHALRTATEDCVSRPGDKTARTVELVIAIKPVAVERNLEEVEVEVSCKVKVPTTRTRGYRMGCEGTSELVYSDHSLDDRRQMPLPLDTGDGEVAGEP